MENDAQARKMFMKNGISHVCFLLIVALYTSWLSSAVMMVDDSAVLVTMVIDETVSAVALLLMPSILFASEVM